MLRKIETIRNKMVLSLLALLGSYFIVELLLWNFLNANHGYNNSFSYIFSMVAILVLCVLSCAVFQFFRHLAGKKVDIKRGYIFLLLFLITVIPRLLVIWAFPVEARVDSYLYMHNAYSLLDTGHFADNLYFQIVAPNAITYPGVLALIFSIFGKGVFIAQCFNLLCFTGAVLCFYDISEKLMNSVSAVVATIAFALVPNTILFSVAVVTEPLTLCTYLLGMCLLVRGMETKSLWRIILFSVSGGLLLGFSNCVRSNAISVVIAFAVFFVAYGFRRDKYQNICNIVRLSATLIGFVFVLSIFSYIQVGLWGEKSSITYGWAMYEGLDNRSFGVWTQENGDALAKTIEEVAPKDVQTAMLHKAMERVKDYSISEWIELFARKGINNWVDSSYAYFVILLDQIPGRAQITLPPETKNIVDVLHQFLLGLFSVSMIALAISGWKKKLDGKVLLITFPIALLVIFHSFATSIPRYQYMAIPLFVLCIAYAAYTMRIERNPVKSEQCNSHV